MQVKVADVNPENEMKLLMDVYTRDVNLHTSWPTCIGHWGIHGHFPAFHAWALPRLLLVCANNHVFEDVVYHLFAVVRPHWFQWNISPKHIFQCDFGLCGLCMLVVCVRVAVLCSRHGNVIILPWCFPLSIQGSCRSWNQIYNHFLIFVMPPNMLFKKRLDFPVIQFSLKC